MPPISRVGQLYCGQNSDGIGDGRHHCILQGWLGLPCQINTVPGRLAHVHVRQARAANATIVLLCK